MRRLQILRRLSTALLLLTIACCISFPFIYRALLTAAPAYPDFDPPSESVFSSLVFAVVASATARIIHRREMHSVGWLLHGTGLSMAAMASGGAAFTLLDFSIELSAPLRVLGIWLNYGWGPAIVLLAVFLPLLFPTGRPPSPRWRWVAWLGGLVMLFATIETAVYAITHDAPIYQAALAEPSQAWVIISIMLAVATLGSAASAVARYRQAGLVERRQLKWVSVALAVVAALIAFALTPLRGDLLTAVGLQHLIALFWTLIPVSIGIAISKYRLFEIDRLVSRTVAYGALAVVAVVIYFGLLTALSLLFPFEDDLAIAASTLAVAALFNPLRKRMQRWADRHFNRSHYDIERATTDMILSLGHQTDQDQLAKALLAAVSTTMLPSSASVWIR